jgi:hypothetical protein
MMRITRLRKYGNLIHSNAKGCPKDVECPGGTNDGICIVNDAPCWGWATTDGDCGWDGDKPCGGLGASDYCVPSTGSDLEPCGGVLRVDIAFNMQDPDIYC